jgi:hypothetical protein
MLSDEFSRTQTRQNLVREMRSRVQGKDESVTEYWINKRYLCYQVNPRMDETEIMEHIVEGLPRRIGALLFTHHVSSLNELKDFLKNQERGDLYGRVQREHVIPHPIGAQEPERDFNEFGPWTGDDLDTDDRSQERLDEEAHPIWS